MTTLERQYREAGWVDHRNAGDALLAEEFPCPVCGAFGNRYVGLRREGRRVAIFECASCGHEEEY